MQEKDFSKIWELCLQSIRKEIPEQSYETWFKPIRAVRLNGAVLTIQVPNEFFYEYIEEHYINHLKKAVHEVLGPDGRLEYQILMDKKGRRTGQEPDDMTPGAFDPNQIKNPFVIPGIRKVAVDPQLNVSYTFDNYIEGDCNKLARNAAIAVARKPGGTAFNPLVVYGDVGLGKTHLVQAIGNAVADRHPDKSVLYVTSEKFTNQIIQSIKNSATNDLVNFYQMLDVLILDDIQFLAGRAKTQEILFHVFNQLHQSGKQIIIASDRPPKDLEKMQERLISRFKWGLTADLQAPEFETRMAILDEKLEKEGIDIPMDVKEYICYNVKDNVRELEGVLISLIAQSSLNGKEITLSLVQEVIQQAIEHSETEITIERIMKHVAEYYNLTPEKLQSKTRKREIVTARQLSMYLSKNLTQNSLKNIGAAFGGRDHTTVLYSCRSVENLMDTDIEFRDTVYALQKKIRMSVN